MGQLSLECIVIQPIVKVQSIHNFRDLQGKTEALAAVSAAGRARSAKPKQSHGACQQLEGDRVFAWGQFE